MKRVYSSPELEIYNFKFSEVLAGEEMNISDPQIPTDHIDPGELE